MAAKALMRLQKSTGLFPRILGKGDNAKRLADQLLRMRSEEEIDATSDPSNTYLNSFATTPSSVVDSIVIIDREVDFATTLLTQLTYEGLIDETFGINYNQTEVDSSIVGPAPQQKNPQASGAAQNGIGNNPSPTKRKILLDSTDKLFPDLCDINFAVLGPLLNKTARRLQSDFEARHKADQSVSDLKSFVAKLPSYQAEQASLKIHTSLAEEIMKITRADIFGRTLEVQQSFVAGTETSSLHDDIEELISRDVRLPTILRLLCLESCTTGGLRQRDLDYFKRLVLHAYGFQHMLTFASLEKMGLLTPHTANTGYLNPMSASSTGTTTDFPAVRKALRLFVDDVDEQDPSDVAYVFSGYAPLSVRIVQCALQKNFLNQLNAPRGAASTNNGANTNPSTPSTQAHSQGWKGFEDVLARIKGATVDEVQRGSDPDASKARQALRGGSGSGPTTSIVFFLGGITYAEIAALRFVGKQLGEKRKLLIATTGIINGDKVVGAATEGGTLGV